MKLRGITLDQATCQKIHFDMFVNDIIKEIGNKPEPIELAYNRFSIDRNSRVVTSRQTKTYRGYFEKGIILPNMLIVPFGYRGKHLQYEKEI